MEDLNIKIVPVTISYDRFFDWNFLAQELISGHKARITLGSFLKQIYDMPTGKMGKVIVRY